MPAHYLEDPDGEQLARVVRRLMTNQNKSEVARDLKIARETLYRWERGDSVPTIEDLMSLARVTGNAVVLRLNAAQEGGIEGEMAEMRRSIEALYQGRILMTELVADYLKDNPDPKVRELIDVLRQQARDLGR